MEDDRQTNVANTDNIHNLKDATRDALSKFRGSGNGGSVVLLLADRKSENMDSAK